MAIYRSGALARMFLCFRFRARDPFAPPRITTPNTLIRNILPCLPSPQATSASSGAWRCSQSCHPLPSRWVTRRSSELLVCALQLAAHISSGVCGRACCF